MTRGDDRIKEQVLLEQEMLSMGANAYDNRVTFNTEKRRESFSKPVNQLVSAGVEVLIGQIDLIKQNLAEGKAIPTGAYILPILDLPSDVIAAVAMRVTLDKLSIVRKVNAVAIEIGEALWAEAMLMRATDREWKRHCVKWKNKRGKRRAILEMENTEQWELKQKQCIGMLLLNMIETHVKVIEIQLLRMVSSMVRVIRITDECMEWLKSVHAQERLLMPLRLPMICVPRMWSNLSTGGYYTQLPGNTLLKDAKHTVDYTTGNEAFLRAANHQQAVGWKINEWVLDQVEHAWANSLAVGGLAPSQGYPIPPYPKHLPDDHEDVTQWKFNARLIHEKNDEDRCRRIHTLKTLWIARRFKRYEEFFYPMQVDFRGRFYYRCHFLNPQGNDLARSLLLFAQGQPIEDEAAANWLRVQGANAFGHGKLSWQARIDWVHANQLEIEAVGRDPWGRSASLWQEASDPWQFLAFCREYQQFCHAGYGYVSSLPIQLDCTCSGIQHYAALLRNQEMAGMVNLLPSDEPQDIYTVLTERVLEVLRTTDDERAAKWLALQPDRSLTKPVVMTLPYSATRRSVMQHCQEWANERAVQLLGTDSWPFQVGGMSTCYYMANIMYVEAEKLIQPAKEAMAWFRKVGKLAGASNIPLVWHTPSQMQVRQRYPYYNISRVTLKAKADVVYRTIVNVYDIENGLNPRQMGNSLSPNVIHSLDSSHMSLTINDAIAAGVANIAGIHDCFSTTAAEMTTVRNVIRATFAKLYSGDWFTSISEELINQLPENKRHLLPKTPELGTLDVQLTNHADYFVS